MYRPTAGDSRIAAAERARAYAEVGRRVPGKRLATKRMAPNSKRREFQVERKWEA
jgi:hypothetical protein